MEKGPREQESQEELAQKAMEAFREVLPRTEGGLGKDRYGISHYATADFTDSKGRMAEVRLLQSPGDPSFFTLNANIGDGMALLELKDKLEAHGLKISRLMAYLADPETQKAMEDAVKI